MKKLLVLMGLAAAAFSFTGCQKNEMKDADNDFKGTSTFEFVADIAQTKTTLDPDTYAVDWEEGDVIYMVTSDGTWGAPYADDEGAKTIAEFTYADGKFATTSTIADGTYTFKAMYAEADQKSYHRGTSTTHKLEAVQAQDCSDPTAHIKANDALVGTFEAEVPMAEPANITMAHLYTLMQVNVKNGTEADIVVTKFEMTAAGADLAGVFYVESFETPSISTKSGASSTITVNVTNGTVEEGMSLPVYFVMAPLSDYSGDVTFKVTDASGNTYTRTVTLSNVTFAAGKYNTTPYTISSADVVEPEPANVTWDLTQASYSSENTDKVTWTSDYVNLSLEKGESTSPANNYLGGTNDHTRVYKDQIMTFAPVGKYQIEKIEYFVVGTSYVDELINSTWVNAEVSSSERTVTVLPDDGHSDVSVTIGAATRFTAITVYYSLDEDYVLPTVKSIAVSGQKEDFVQNSSFEFGGIVTATYSNGKTADVTDKSSFEGYNLAEIGTQTVTVSYTEGNITVKTTYQITINELTAGVTDVLTRAVTGITNNSYSEWSDKTVTSSAVYAGQSAGGNDAIQLRSDKSNSGIVTTKSGGYVKKMVVTWNSNTAEGRTLNVYGKNSAYSKATDLYDDNTKGTLLGTIVCGKSTELEITGNYQYIGLRSADGAMYLDEIKIIWSSEASDVPAVPELAVDPATVEVTVAGGNAEFGYTVTNPTEGVSVLASTTVDWISAFNYTTANKVIFTVAENTSTEAREAVITLSYEGAESKKVTVKQDAAEASEPEEGGTITISKNISDISGTSVADGTKVSMMIIDENITASASTKGNNGKIYNSGAQWRLYQSDEGTLTISAKAGYIIKSLKFTYNTSNGGTLLSGSTNVASGTTHNVDASSITYSVGNTGTATNGQVRVTAIEVVYQAN
ncbi:MAG: hypothetical protein IKA34_01055 [Bacteroidales bacterium]|nr:hypothetical protein [Bacteroidales bacterium]